MKAVKNCQKTIRFYYQLREETQTTQNATGQSPNKFRKFLRSQSFHTKYGLFLKRYSRQKVTVTILQKLVSCHIKSMGTIFFRCLKERLKTDLNITTKKVLG